jgi:hypothetical protein
MMSPSQQRELRAGLMQGLGIGAVVLVVAAIGIGVARLLEPQPAGGAQVPAVAAEAPRRIDFGTASPPDDVRWLASWAVASNDTRSAPFVLIDKRRTQLYVFDGQGRLQGQTPVLLGYAPGDDSVPGIGQRPIEQVRPSERTTPAGRPDITSGRNLLDEDVVWIDYDAAVSLHRVRVTDARERRLERLATPTTDDNRISNGCINVPVAFFEETVWPLIGRRHAVAYVLPEAKSLHDAFPQAAAWHASQGAPLLATQTKTAH